MRAMTVADMARIRHLHDLQLSPDERLTAFVEDWQEEDDGKWRSRVCVMAQTETQLDENTHQPRFSSDGRHLYFLRDLADGAQLFRVAASDLRAPAQQMTRLRHGVCSYDLGADGRTIAFSSPVWPGEDGLTEMTAEERAEFAWQREWGPAEITRIDYKHDSCYGIRDGSVMTLGTLDAETGEARLIPCAFPLDMPVLSPDCTRIACYGQPHTGARWSRQEVFLIDNETVTPLTDGALLSGTCPVRFTPDGQTIIYPAWYAGESTSEEVLYRVSAQGGEPVCLFDPEHDTVSSGINGAPIRTEHGRRRGMFEVTEDRVWFAGAFGGRGRVYAISLEGKQLPEQALGGEYSIHEFVRLRDGGFLTLRGDDTTFADLYRNDRRLRDSNPWMQEIALGQTLIRQVESRDGKASIRSRVTLPVGYEEGRRYPVVLYLHGGPECCYTTDVWHEVQILAGRGYVVVCCDPRGSAGYGLAFCNDELSWGDEAYDDMMACLEDAEAMGAADPAREGVTGGSYGGYMTCKIIMKTQRFRAACAQRTFVNKATSYGTGDIGFYSARMKPEDVVVRDCLLQRSRTSIIRDIDRVTTPLLLLHGYNDYRCSFEQSEQMFIALKERRRDVPVRMVMFPGENHEVSRSGLLSHRQTHVREMCDWFDRFLKEVQA
ncbi:MAG: prolyl oligopeptidase family serine peptidase [Aristaeellaceae bacterium]